MASLSVNKNNTSLDVTVKHTQQFRTDYPLFSPFAGKDVDPILKIISTALEVEQCMIPCKDESNLQRRPNVHLVQIVELALAL
ncbi:hypothetical protein P3S68_029389 [Capsicum galapagoense]